MSDSETQYNQNWPAIEYSPESGKVVIILRPHHPAYMPGFWLLVIGLICAVLLLVFLSGSETFGNYRWLSSAPYSDANSLVSDVELLKGQMNYLITGTMESKIQRLEQNLKSGIISRKDLATLQELKEDLKVLEVHSPKNPAMASGLSNGIAGTKSPTHAQAALYSERLLKEISQVRNLFFISIASCGGVILIIGGAWLRGYYRPGRIQCERCFRRPMLEKPESGYS